VGSINSFVHIAHDKNVLCGSYIVNSTHDATESYYERGKHGLMDLNNIKFPLLMLQILKLHLFYLTMLVTMCLIDLFSYKIPMHRMWFRFKCVSYLLFDALSCFKFLYGAFALSSFMAPT
jgi:polyferredoxin